MRVGDIFYFDVAYTKDPSKFSNRPSLILDELDGDILLLISTTTKERRHTVRGHDRYKIPILNWRRTGLSKASWCRGKILIRVAKEELETLVKSKDYIGRMDPDDFNYIVDEVERMNK